MWNVYNTLTIFSDYVRKNTSCSYSSLNSRIWLKHGQGILHTRRYTMVNADLGSLTCAHFPLGTDVRYSCIPIGVKMHSYHAILVTGNCQRAGFSASCMPTSTNYVGEWQSVLTLKLGCSGLSKKTLQNGLFEPLFERYFSCYFSTTIVSNATKLGTRCQWAPTMPV